MGFLDRARHKLTGAVDKHGDKVAQGIDRAAKKMDDKTGGKHTDKLATGAERAKDALEKLDGKDDGDLRRPGETPRPPR